MVIDVKEIAYVIKEAIEHANSRYDSTEKWLLLEAQMKTLANMLEGKDAKVTYFKHKDHSKEGSYK